MTRKMYTLTERDLNKCAREARYAAQDMAYVEENRKKLGKKYGLKKRDAARRALKGDPEYVRGLWQARIDAANGLDYAEERLENSYNMGYYTGYTEYERDLRGGLVVPTEYI